jgi:hypothetical protein
METLLGNHSRGAWSSGLLAMLLLMVFAPASHCEEQTNKINNVEFVGKWEGKSKLGTYYMFSFLGSNVTHWTCRTELFSKQIETWKISGPTVSNNSIKGWIENSAFATNFPISVYFSGVLITNTCRMRIEFADAAEEVLLRRMPNSALDQTKTKQERQ